MLVIVTVILLLLTFPLSSTTVAIEDLEHVNCTAEEASAIAHRYRKSGRKGDDDSRCPQETWLEAMAESDEIPYKTLMNIGFNKGYNFAVWANLFAPFSGIDSMKWFKAIDRTETYKDWHEACGKCSDCGVRVNTSKWSFDSNQTNITMIGMDMNKNNVDLVHKVVDILTNESGVSFHGINLKIHFAGGSDKLGDILLPLCAVGDESCSLTSDSSIGARNDSRVPLLTVDQIVLDLDVSEGLQAGGTIVDILLIDTV
jgi:hypothetical protein